MNKELRKILIISFAVLAAGILFLPSANAQAVDELVVEYWTGTAWEPLAGPIFSETNFLPGQNVTRLVRVTNKSGQPQRIATEAININDPNNLGDVFDLEIKEGTTIRYSNTLSNFFEGGEAYLSDLATNSNTQYDFTISFDSSVEDPDYQGKSLGFNILIGFQAAAGGMPPGWGGGGGGVLPPGLTIKYEKEIYLGTTTATIEWETSYDATSQIIYDTLPGKFNLNPATGGGPSNYGYAFSKEGDDIFDLGKGKMHRVTLTGLTENTTYYYRCVSHGSLAISTEHSFTTLGVKEEEEAIKKEAVGQEVPVIEISLDELLSKDREETTEEEEKPSFAEATEGKKEEGIEEGPIFDFGKLLAGIGGLFKLKNLPWLILLFLAIIIILLILRRRKKKE